jgi:hypothetical protein
MDNEPVRKWRKIPDSRGVEKQYLSAPAAVPLRFSTLVLLYFLPAMEVR